MSILLKTSARLLIKIMLLISFLLVLRGHHYPGGGFIGALVAVSAMALYHLAFGVEAVRALTWPPKVVVLGLFCLLISLFLPLFIGMPSLSGLWAAFDFFGQTIKVGLPLVFDFGIYFLIIGSLSWLMSKIEVSFL